MFPPPGRAFAALSLAMLALSGCVTELVEKKRPRKGPVPEVGFVDTGGGEIRYSVEGWGPIVSLRRGSAMRRIRRVCKKLKLVINDEFTRDDVQVPYSGEDLEDNLRRGVDHYAVAPFHHIVFECELPPEALTPVVQASTPTAPSGDYLPSKTP